MPNRYTYLRNNRSSIENKSSEEIKTTDVNILLNRVRLDKKKTFKKNILVSFLLVSLVSSISIFLLFRP